MSILKMHSVPVGTMLENETTFLCVFDEDNNFIADYDFCTGLRLIQEEQTLVIYINENDLVPGSWVLFVTTVDENYVKTKSKVKGTKEGLPRTRIHTSQNPWDGCGAGEKVSLAERDSRITVCASCPLLNAIDMVCSVSGKSVTDATTRKEQFCPEDKWGNKEQVLNDIAEFALANNMVQFPQGFTIDTSDQIAFEEELASYLEGLQ